MLLTSLLLPPPKKKPADTVPIRVAAAALSRVVKSIKYITIFSPWFLVLVHSGQLDR